MKPPMCTICYKEFLDTEEGGLVYFQKRSSDERWINVMKEESMQGHPPFAEWFCAEHYEAAKELKELTIDEAMKNSKGKNIQRVDFMKPPVCVICDVRFNPQKEGGVVNFAKRKGDIEWDKKKIVEHPPYAEWFCGKHFDYAESLSELTKNIAMPKIKERFI